MTATRLCLAAAIVLAMAPAAGAAEAPAGAAACSGCHASNARVETPVPPLTGRPDIADAMIDYKTGKRPGTIMDRIAKGFSDDEIRAIAAWYAGQK